LNTALRYEMEQTPYLNLLGLDKTYATMGQLKLAPTTKITPEVASQICSETNSKMVISNSIADAGNASGPHPLLAVTKREQWQDPDT
jgi:hypothetical protein